VAHHELLREQNGETVKLHPGDSLVVSLPDNPTTGFRWTVESFDSGVLEACKEDYSTASTAVGGGGERRFCFRAISTGSTVLTLKLWRSWEGDRSVRARFQATVIVT